MKTAVAATQLCYVSVVIEDTAAADRLSAGYCVYKDRFTRARRAEDAENLAVMYL